MRIRRAAVDAIIAHARADAPRECCGLLIGSVDEVEEAFPTLNTREGSRTFMVDPAGHFAAIRRARAAGRMVVGAYHSHPRSAAAPSPTDVREATDPQLLHVIVSLEGPQPAVHAYRIQTGRYTEVCLTIAR